MPRTVTRTYTSFTYGTGAVLGTGFVGGATYFWLDLMGIIGHSTVSLPPLLAVGGLVVIGLMAIGVVFAVRRTWVRVSVSGGVVRIEQRLRSSFECPLEGLAVSVRLVDSADATPGPRLVQDPKRSAAIRSAVRFILGSRDASGILSSTPASEDFARLDLQAADGREHMVLLPGISSLDQLDDLRGSFPFETQA